MMNRIKILIAAGGTGGHLFPGIAIAEAIARLHPQATLTFVGTKRGLESRIIPQTNWRLVTMTVPSMTDRRGVERCLVIFRMPFVLLRALLLVLRERPSCVIGIGGYAAGPVVLMAALVRIPCAIVEPNAIAGRTNRWVGRFVRRIFIGFPEATTFFPVHKVMVTGNPVRATILAAMKQTPVAHDRFTIFCFGGSQGARHINQIVIEALAPLQSLRDRLRFIHQVGPAENIEQVRRAYRDLGFEAEVHVFIDQIAQCYARADLVIARAGATTIAELLVLAKPSILVPYPFAADGHQQANAENVVRIGGAVMFLDQAFTGDRLAAEIRLCVAEPWRLERMAAALVKAGHPDAAERIVGECWKLMKAA